MVRYAAAGSIAVYQRWISPRKGFCCAYRARTGGRSCSEYARQTVLEHGVLTLARAMPRQFARCRRAYAALCATAAEQTPEEDGKRRNGRRAASGDAGGGWADAFTCLDGASAGGDCAACPCDGW